VRGFIDVVNVMRPTEATDETGGLQGQDTCVRRMVPCSRTHIGGTKTEVAHTDWPSGTYQFEYYADPLRQVTPKDYLIDPFEKRLMNDGTTQNRTFRIEEINEGENGGTEVVIATEAK